MMAAPRIVGRDGTVKTDVRIILLDAVEAELLAQGFTE